MFDIFGFHVAIAVIRIHELIVICIIEQIIKDEIFKFLSILSVLSFSVVSKSFLLSEFSFMLIQKKYQSILF